MIFSKNRRPSDLLSSTSRQRRRADRSGLIRLGFGLEGLEDRTVPAFIAPVDYVSPASIVAASVADFNGDGMKDIVSVGSLSGRGLATVMLNDGTGKFTPAPSSPTASSPVAVEVGDFDGDGKLDLIERTGAGFSIEPGNGDGTFGGVVTIAAPTGTSLLEGDFNGDGGTDLASTSSSGTVSVLMNDNSGITGVVTSTNFALSAPTSTVAGAVLPVTVTAVDSAGNVQADFAGTVTILTSDARGSGQTYTFTPNDAGMHTFAAVRLVTAGAQSVTATSPFIGSASRSIVVATDAAARIGITAPAVSTAGDPMPISLISLDAYGNMGAAYTGTVHFSSSDAQAGLPAGYTFTPADGGIHAFTAVLKSSGYRTITATDTASPTLTGTTSSVGVAPLAASTLSVTGRAGSIGVARPVTVIARDIFGNVATSDNGAVHFAGSDPSTVLPADGPLVNGSAVFHVRMMAEGSQTLAVTDVANPGINGSESIVGTPATAGSLAISGYPSATAGTAQSFTVRVIDILGKLDTSYTGTISFGGSDAQAGLPAAYTFTAADAGVHTFVATLRTAGSRTITAADPLAGAFGVQSGIVIKAAAATSLVVSGGHNAVAGVAIPVTVTALDAFGNVATDYSGKVKFTSNDVLAGLPATYSFTAADAGIHSFPVILKTANTRTTLTSVTVADTSNAALTASLTGLDVVNGVAARVTIDPPTNVTAGSAFSLRVTVLDAFANKVKNYTGTIHFSDSAAAAGLPADYTFNAADAGVHSFTVILNTAVTQTITVVDLADSSLLGTVTVAVKASGGGGGTGGGGKR